MNAPRKRPSVKPLVMRWGPDPEAESLRRELEATKQSLEAAQARLASVEQVHARCAQQMREVMDRNSNLVQLTVASQLLCGGSDRDGVLNAIEEIVVNMIGSEEVAILEFEPDGDRVHVARVRGIDQASPRFMRAVEHVREAMRTGRVVLPASREVTAIVPLKIESMMVGVVAVFRLLQQKPALDALDHELLELLSHQGAVAIFSTEFRSMKPTVRPPKVSH